MIVNPFQSQALIMSRYTMPSPSGVGCRLIVCFDDPSLVVSIRGISLVSQRLLTWTADSGDDGPMIPMTLFWKVWVEMDEIASKVDNKICRLFTRLIALICFHVHSLIRFLRFVIFYFSRVEQTVNEMFMERRRANFEKCKVFAAIIDNWALLKNVWQLNK